MARAILERELTPRRTGGLDFTVAGRSDDGDIRRLLRRNAMAGEISLSFEREPDYFADVGWPGELKQTIVARDGGRLLCAGSCTIRGRFVNGTPRRVGYLGGLRLDAGQAGRFDILRRGYEFFHQLQKDSPAEFYFTSIATDNERARKFLERGLPGMPRYECVADFVTMLLPVRRRAGVKEPTTFAPSEGELLGFINDSNQRRQFAPCWSAEELLALGRLGLHPEDFRCVRAEGRMAAVGALWDQGGFKQTVIRGYSSRLAAARPVLNAINRALGRPPLPALGGRVAHACVSHLAAAENDAQSLVSLIADLRRLGAQRRVQFLTLGFAANDPRLAMLRGSVPCREYHSRLYLVSWPGLGRTARELDDRFCAPEVALL